MRSLASRVALLLGIIVLPFGCATHDPGSSSANDEGGVGGASGAAGSGGHCEDLGFEPGTLECTAEQLCADNPCGPPVSPFDAQGCWRKPCPRDGPCPSGQECLNTALLLDHQCEPSSTYECYWFVNDEQCACSSSADCGYREHCVPVDVYDALDLCDVSSLFCPRIQELYALSAAMQNLGAPTDGGADMPTTTLAGCWAAVKARHAELGCAEPLP